MNPASVSICVLTYGDFPDLARRCIESILKHCPRSDYRLLVGANAPNERTKEYLEALEAEGTIDTLICSAENINKCPMMRRLFEQVETEYIWWFDDDSWIDDPNAFALWLGVARAASPETMIWGRKYFVSHEHEFSYGRDPVEWVRRASWFSGRQPPSWQPGGKDVTDYCGRESGDGRWFFVTGGCWLIKTEAVRALDWPDRRLLKAGDDVLLGEALRQKGWTVGEVVPGLNPCGVAISDYSRRGEGEGPNPTQRQGPRPRALVEVVIVNWKRPQNVRRIVEAFALQKRFSSITLIDAAGQPEYALPPDVLRQADRHFIFSDNFGSFNRFVPCLGYMAPYTLFHDDDLLPGRHAIEHLVNCAAEYPHFSVMGEFGRNISAQGKELTADMRRSPRKVLPVDFLVRSYFVRTANLKHFFIAAAALGVDRIECEDDLLLCTSLQQATKYPCVVTRDAGKEASLACEHLPEPFALWHRPEHFPRREQFIRSQMESGWRPLQSAARDDAMST
ncbi:MAG: glycosyltransferase [Chthoniobacter sp.]|uniref:glycosyltransferase n=1 Tax=Chthoniobacter sp. TaxID=2510640 RepID=UPI0032A7967D